MSGGKRAILYLPLLLGSVLFVTPFLFALSASLKKLDAVYAYLPRSCPSLPSGPTTKRRSPHCPSGSF